MKQAMMAQVRTDRVPASPTLPSHRAIARQSLDGASAAFELFTRAPAIQNESSDTGVQSLPNRSSTRAALGSDLLQRCVSSPCRAETGEAATKPANTSRPPGHHLNQGRLDTEGQSTGDQKL